MNISTHTGYHTDTYRGTPYRIRTGVAAVKGQCPRPLDEGCILAPVERIEPLYCHCTTPEGMVGSQGLEPRMPEAPDLQSGAVTCSARYPKKLL